MWFKEGNFTMDYISLNNLNRNRIKSAINSDVKFDWEYPALMDILMGKLPLRRYSRYDDNVRKELNELDDLVSGYDGFHTDKEDFIAKISKIIDYIHDKEQYWMGLTLYEIKNAINMHKVCILYGEGGIGKTYFIKCLEEQLGSIKTPHLCVYGKFLRNIEDINTEEIIKASKSGFVLIVDAINEISDENNKKLIEIVKMFKKMPQIRIIITYRSNRMQEDILEEYLKLADAEHQFKGVSFYSALDGLIESAVPDIHKYEDILYSNNALLLGGLRNWLSNWKLVNERANSVNSITYIFENIIENAITKAVDKNISTELWKDVKKIAEWMFKHGQKYIDAVSLYSVIKCKNCFIPVMEQMGFMHTIGNQYYVFSLEQISDFLIGRSLFDTLKNKSEDEVIKIVKEKLVKFSSLTDVFILAIFDKFCSDYEKIQSILLRTDLIDKFNYRLIAKIVFHKSSFENFRKFFMPNNKEEMFLCLGGFNNKPFNCENYFYEYYRNNMQGLIRLSKALSGKHMPSTIASRLKNILYFINCATIDSSKSIEAFKFAVLCCCAPNQTVRALATKLLYDIAECSKSYNGESKENYNVFLDNMIEAYVSFPDYYIRESIIDVLAKQVKDDKITAFFRSLINTDNTLSATSIGKIAVFLGQEYDYINWERENLYVYDKNARISEYMNNLMFNIDCYEKDFLPFRYFGENTINIFNQFLDEEKSKIRELNKTLKNDYECVKDGYCQGRCSLSTFFDSKTIDDINIKDIDKNSFICSLEKIIICITQEYLLIDNQKEKCNFDEFSNSILRKCIDIAVGIFYGSLMCNYYINNFASYNSKQNIIGYELYDPLEYEDDINIVAPLPMYCNKIEKLGTYTINKIHGPLIKDEAWAVDAELARQNVLNLIKPISLNDGEWVLLGGRITMHQDDDKGNRWRETYDIWCCTSDDVTICEDGNARYLTIELETYEDTLNQYKLCKEKPYLCKRMRQFSSNIDVIGETSLVLPPAALIEDLNLQLLLKETCWCYGTETVMICNNTKGNYYKDPIVSNIYIKKKYLDKYLENHTIKYFAFTERLVGERGFRDETSLHFEIKNGVIKKEVPNHLRIVSENKSNSCDNCQIKIEAEERIKRFNLADWINGEEDLED